MQKLKEKNWVQKQYCSNSDFKQLMDDAQIKYKQAFQIALYANLDRVEKLRVMQRAGVDDKGNQIYCFYGMFLPMDQQLIEKVFLLMISRMDQEVSAMKSKYNLIFFNTLCEGYTNYTNFKNLLKSMPLKYFVKLNKIIIVHPNLSLKSLEWFSFGVLNKVISKSLVFVEKLQELYDHGINAKVLSSKLPRQIINTDKSYEEVPRQLKQKPKQNHMLTSIGQQKQINNTKKTDKEPEKSGIIGLKIEKLEMCEIGIPLVIKMLLGYFELKPEAALCEGVFRKNADFEQQKKLEIEIAKRNYDYLYTVEDTYVVCGLIKKVFGSMQQPLFGYELYEEIIKNKQPPNQIFIKSLIKKLPAINYRTLQFTLDMLLQKIIPYQQANKMNMYNLSVVFAPCFFRPKQYKLDDLLHSKKLVNILEKILQGFNLYFGSKQTIDSVYRRSSQAISKQKNEQFYGVVKRNSIKEKELNRLRGKQPVVLKKFDPDQSITMSEVLNFE